MATKNVVFVENPTEGEEDDTKEQRQGKRAKMLTITETNYAPGLGYGRHRQSLERKRVFIGAILDEYKMKTSNVEICEFARSNDVENVQKMLKDDASAVNAKDSLELTPLHFACNANILELTKLLLDCEEVDVNIVSLEGVTPLFCAVHRENLDIVNMLIDSNLKNIDTKTKAVGLTSLDHAVEMGYVDIVKALIAASANTDVQDWFGESPLHRAAQGNHIEIVQMLLSARTTLDTLNEDDSAALHHAASCGHLDTVKLLVRQKADVNIQNKEDDSALHCAFLAEHYDIVEYLVKHDCDVSLTDKHGDTVLKYAIKALEQDETSNILNEVKKRYSVKERQFISCNELQNVTQQPKSDFGKVYNAELIVHESTEKGKETLIVTVPVTCKISEEGFVLENLQPHPNIHSLLAMCLSFEFEESKPGAVVFPRKEGGSVKDNIMQRNGPLRFRKMIEWATDMAEAVNYLHENNIKHSDIAARNFLLTEKELGPSVEGQRLVLTNFDLARSAEVVFDEDRMLPWRWSPPETLKSFGRTTSLEGDMWMIGICLWELLAVNPLPFHWIPSIKDLTLKVAQHSRAPLLFPPIGDANQKKWKEIILNCCSYDPKDRYSAQILLKEVKLLLQRTELQDESSEAKQEVDDDEQAYSIYYEPQSDDEVDFEELKLCEEKQNDEVQKELDNEREQRKQLEKDYETVSSQLVALEQQFSNLKRGLDISKDEVAFLASELADAKEKLNSQPKKHARRFSTRFKRGKGDTGQ